MFRESRRRFLAGFAAMGVGGTLLGRAAFAQTATSFQCEGPITTKAVTSLKPGYTKAGVYTDLVWGKLEAPANKFGRYAEVNFVGTVGKLAKDVFVVTASKASNLKLSYFAKSGGGEESLNIYVDLQSLAIGNHMEAQNMQSALIDIPAFAALNPSTAIGEEYEKKTITPSISARLAAPAGTLKAKFPKNGTFTAKVMVGGKAIAEVKFPNIALAKIYDAMNKDLNAQAVKLAADPNLKGDLSTAALPTGCYVSKPSSSGRTGCFLTTASTREIGLSDDCWELTQLHILGNRLIRSGGRSARLMLEYYRKAPDVVERINARADARKIWLRFYWSCIVPSALAMQLQLAGLAGRIYIKGSRQLQQMVT